MSSIHKDSQQESSICRGTIKSFEAAIKLLHEITSTSRGPDGKTKILQNLSGGKLTLTSSSKRLFSSLSIRKPIIQLLVSAAQGHLCAYSDGGLFVVSLASDLILKSINSGQNLKILSEIYEQLLTYAIECLNSQDFNYRFSAHVTSIGFMTSYVRTVMGSKPLCTVGGNKLQHLTRLILECFLSGTSDIESNCSTSTKVFILCNEGFDIKDSKTYPGILVSAPELSKFRVKEMNLVKKEFKGEKQITVALVTVSMSGDMDELPHVNYEVDLVTDMDSLVIDELSRFCDGLVTSGIGLVLCQKVVHPSLKNRLGKAGVLVIDRIGIQPVGYITKLTGAVPIQCLTTTISDTNFGWIDSAQHSIIHGKSYLHLTKADNSVTTLLLCHQQEEPLNELKEVCTTALDSLDQLLYNPYVLAGGGCWQVGLTNHIDLKVHQNKISLLQDLECSESVLTDACQIFTQSLQRAALSPHSNHAVNNINGHVYTKTKADNSEEPNYDKQICNCRLEMSVAGDTYTELRFRDGPKLDSIIQHQCRVASLPECLESRELILDSLSMSVNALQTGVLTACSALNIGQVLENVC